MDYQALDDAQKLREELEKEYGEVLTTDEATEKYQFESFCAGFAFVTRKSDGVKGSLDFSHMPRFYFDFRPIGK